MSARVFASIGELATEVDTHLGYSDWHVVDQGMIDGFAAATGDHQWIHVDATRATTGPFGTTVAHGFLTLALIPSLLWDVIDVQGAVLQVNYGVNGVRFPAPVPVDSRLRGGVTLLVLKPFAQGYQSVFRVSVESEAGELAVCVADVIMYLVP
jgi:acyl dehydratase